MDADFILVLLCMAMYAIWYYYINNKTPKVEEKKEENRELPPSYEESLKYILQDREANIDNDIKASKPQVTRSGSDKMLMSIRRLRRPRT